MFVSGPVGTSVTVEPGGSVNLRRDPQRPHERTVGARGDRDVRPTGERQDPERVAGRRVETRVAADGRDPEQVDLRPRDREEDRERVVVAGIAVQDDRPGPRHGGRLLLDRGVVHAPSVAGSTGRREGRLHPL
jgi:hypothetical protein